MKAPGKTGHGPAGFSLIEVVGALVIFTVGLGMVMQLSGALGVQVESSAISSEIVVLAGERLDSLARTPFDSHAPGQEVDTTTVRGRRYRMTSRVSRHGPLLLRVEVDLEPVAGPGPKHSARSYLAGRW